MQRSGKCLCGAVSYTAEGLKPKLTACHCETCRRWTGGPLFAIGAEKITWVGDDKITVFKSSDWAERGFCSVCGSSLFYRITTPGPYQGRTNLAFGTLDDPRGVDLSLEYFIDKKPEAYALAGEHKTMTAAEVFAIFSGDA